MDKLTKSGFWRIIERRFVQIRVESFDAENRFLYNPGETVPTFDQIMNWVIMVAGIANAIIIAMQGFDLLKTKDSTGVSIKMFAFFIVFQAVFAINGSRLGDKWQMWGMIASIVSTIWVLYLTIRYRKPSYGRRMRPDTEI